MLTVGQLDGSGPWGGDSRIGRVDGCRPTGPLSLRDFVCYSLGGIEAPCSGPLLVTIVGTVDGVRSYAMAYVFLPAQLTRGSVGAEG